MLWLSQRPNLSIEWAEPTTKADTEADVEVETKNEPEY